MTTPTSPRQRPITTRALLIVTLVAGIFGLLVLLMPDGTMLTVLVTMGAVVGLTGSSKSRDERENQLLWQSFATSFEALFIAVYFTYGFVMLSDWLHIAVALTGFMNAHWPGLIASGMCILLGVNGLRKFQEIQ